MSTVTTRRGANHTFHMAMTVLTFGLWGLFVWPIAALIGRRTKVTYPPVANTAQYLHQPNAVNPYNGQAYYDHNRPTRPGYGGAPDIWQR
jgi:hypothetical protein